MDRIGERTYLPYLNVKEGNAGVLVGLPIAGAMLGSAVSQRIGVVVGLLVGLFVGTAVVYATPTHLTATTWLQDLGRYLVRPRRTLHATTEDEPATDGGVGQYAPVGVDETTQDLTGLRRAWPGAAVVERQDGAMEAWLKVVPANMDFAMSDDWSAVQGRAREFANSELDWDLTMHATTRSFPTDEMVTNIEDRLSDPDVQDNEVFAALLEEYYEERPRRLEGVQELHYYLGVEVDRMAVYEEYDTETTPLERLTRIPILGTLVFSPFVSGREDLDEQEVHERMRDRLAARLETVEAEFVRGVNGWSARRLSTLEIMLLAYRFWNGEAAADAVDPTTLVGDAPVMGRQSRDHGGVEP
jgi:hypothetical protein